MTDWSDAQAEALDAVLNRIGQPVDVAVSVTVNEQEIVDRLSKRAVEAAPSGRPAVMRAPRLFFTVGLLGATLRAASLQ